MCNIWSGVALVLAGCVGQYTLTRHRKTLLMANYEGYTQVLILLTVVVRYSCFVKIMFFLVCTFHEFFKISVPVEGKHFSV